MVTEDTNIGTIGTGTMTRREISTINGKKKANTTATTATTIKIVTINPSLKI